MQNAAKRLAMAIWRSDRPRAVFCSVLRRADCAEADALSEHSKMCGRDPRLREKNAGDHRREQARGQTYPLKDWSHRRLSVPKSTLGFDRLRGQASRDGPPCGETTLRKLMRDKSESDAPVFTFDLESRPRSDRHWQEENSTQSIRAHDKRRPNTFSCATPHGDVGSKARALLWDSRSQARRQESSPASPLGLTPPARDGAGNDRRARRPSLLRPPERRECRRKDRGGPW